VKRASIAQTSRVGALDNAALAAVNHAAIPTPPAELGPQKRTMLVWVRFRLASQD
jgi:outer membrane biosynthesis protein TonB